MSPSSDSPAVDTPNPAAQAADPAPMAPTVIVQNNGAGRLQRFMSFVGWTGFILCAFAERHAEMSQKCAPCSFEMESAKLWQNLLRTLWLARIVL